ncbi:ptprb [Bugula neritina]|uniref:Ptprb n=1 Tax=Bugula neritina TaxID=10212 RepID=A0A7J7JBT7_BUGNE|nr:ptprb [Bugula neritina]
MILSYLILVQRKTRSKRAVSSSNCIPSSDSQSVSRSSLTLTQSCYITAEILANDTKLSTPGGYEFTVGDGKSYNGYMNTKLISATDYDVWIATTWVPNGSKDEYVKVISEGHSFKAPGPAPVFKDNSQSTPSNQSKGGPIGGAIGGVGGAVVVVIIIIVSIRRRRANRNKETSAELGLDNLGQPQPANAASKPASVSKKSTSTARPPSTARPRSADHGAGNSNPTAPAEDGFYANTNAAQFNIPIRQLEEYITNCQETISEHYGRLMAIPDPNMSIALLPENKGKNRYKGLYPGNLHRVKLNRPNGSDYINATYLELKCFQYWPENHEEEMVFGDISVVLQSTDVWADYAIRTLRVTKGSETRVIKHYNYIGWPDHGVPDDMGPFIIFYQKIKLATQRFKDRPLLVHCRFGILCFLQSTFYF